MDGAMFCVDETLNPPIPFVPKEVSSEPSTLYRTKRTLPVYGDAFSEAVAATRIWPDRVTVPVAGPTSFELSPIDRDPPLPNEVSKVTAELVDVGAPTTHVVDGLLGLLLLLPLGVPLDGALHPPAPIALTARTLMLYSVPLVRPVTERDSEL